MMRTINDTNNSLFSFCDLLEKLGRSIISVVEECPNCQNRNNLMFYNVDARGEIIMERDKKSRYASVICVKCMATGEPGLGRYRAWKNWNNGILVKVSHSQR